ncbi:hypothetical protein DEU56DRAFT_787511 [Suillus clintonianus]|uniref:uncharacterized protein n=1 Tax=Suillus clintonianus TaxID=1904413 RepID=UPI001B864ACE|nr:uncharacterized protein DEU56DRAFT_787511 [Suillus clintonianus]KAG2146333.1 hypothetical protein DEU56DRAFT_787511 [Suillus clintonianus]
MCQLAVACSTRNPDRRLSVAFHAVRTSFYVHFLFIVPSQSTPQSFDRRLILSTYVRVQFLMVYAVPFSSWTYTSTYHRRVTVAPNTSTGTCTTPKLIANTGVS